MSVTTDRRARLFKRGPPSDASVGPQILPTPTVPSRRAGADPARRERWLTRARRASVLIWAAVVIYRTATDDEADGSAKNTVGDWVQRRWYPLSRAHMRLL